MVPPLPPPCSPSPLGLWADWEPRVGRHDLWPLTPFLTLPSWVGTSLDPRSVCSFLCGTHLACRNHPHVSLLTDLGSMSFPNWAISPQNPGKHNPLLLFPGVDTTPVLCVQQVVDSRGHCLCRSVSLHWPIMVPEANNSRTTRNHMVNWLDSKTLGSESHLRVLMIVLPGTSYVMLGRLFHPAWASVSMST